MKEESEGKYRRMKAWNYENVLKWNIEETNICEMTSGNDEMTIFWQLEEETHLGDHNEH